MALMANDKQAKVRLFGEFRNWVSAGEVTVELGGLQTVGDLKKGLVGALQSLAKTEELNSLMAVSVLAEESRILNDSEKLVDLRTSSFALLPPVCGG
jgi:molybdopterin converting factor small subunit